MAEVITTIKKTGGDYATQTAWEADLDNAAVYNSGDDAIGEVYNDGGAYDETFTINGGATVGLTSRKLRAASGEEHDGTEGSGARIVRTGSGTVVSIAIGATSYETLEIDFNGQAANPGFDIGGGITNVTVRRCLLHGINRNGNTSCLKTAGGATTSRLLNNIVYDNNTNNASAITYSIEYGSGGATNYISNNTVYDTSAGGATATACGFQIVDDSDLTIENNIAMATTGNTNTDFNFAGTNPTSNNNMSEDDSADDGGGSNHQISKSTTGQFVSTTGGSEDFHLVAGSDAVDNGKDLATTPTGVEIDIDGRDRDAQGDTWDIGADELVVSIPDIRHLPTSIPVYASPMAAAYGSTGGHSA